MSDEKSVASLYMAQSLREIFGEEIRFTSLRWPPPAVPSKGPNPAKVASVRLEVTLTDENWLELEFEAANGEMERDVVEAAVASLMRTLTDRLVTNR